MQHIRDMRNQPGYKPNTRHCMYGQDADLIMLGLVSHEPHFTLLREIIDFRGGFSRNNNALKEVKKFTKQSDFQLLHLSILREYLEFEFAYGLEPDPRRHCLQPDGLTEHVDPAALQSRAGEYRVGERCCAADLGRRRIDDAADHGGRVHRTSG